MQISLLGISIWVLIWLPRFTPAHPSMTFSLFHFQSEKKKFIIWICNRNLKVLRNLICILDQKKTPTEKIYRCFICISLFKNSHQFGQATHLQFHHQDIQWYIQHWYCYQQTFQIQKIYPKFFVYRVYQ